MLLVKFSSLFDKTKLPFYSASGEFLIHWLKQTRTALEGYFAEGGDEISRHFNEAQGLENQ